MKGQRIRRAIILVLALTAAALALASLALRVPAIAAMVAVLPIGPGLDPTPLPPAIAAPRGALPTRPVSALELQQSASQGYAVVGSGFFLKAGETTVGVTTGHSLPALGQPGNHLQGVAFALPGATDHLAEFTQLWGLPGRGFSGDDLSVDYVLLSLPGDAGPDWALEPDPRGGPQPGERVALYSGPGGPGGGVRALAGTVTSSTPAAAWLLMDETFDPGGMSGSPVLSAYTGRVVGMAVAATHVRGRVLIGLNPIGGIVAHAWSANTFPLISSFVR